MSVIIPHVRVMCTKGWDHDFTVGTVSVYCRRCGLVVEPRVHASKRRASGNLPSGPGRAALIRRLQERDGEGCVYCGCRFDCHNDGPDGPTIDHYVPRTQGGTNFIENLRVACRSCNHRKGNRMPTDDPASWHRPPGGRRD